MVRIAQAIDGHQVLVTHPVAGGDVAQGVARRNLVPTGPSTHPRPRHLEPAAGFDVVRVAEAIQAHQ